MPASGYSGTNSDLLQKMTRLLKQILKKLIINGIYAAFPVICLLSAPYLILDSYIRRKLHIKPRIIWGPTPIINIATNAAADRLTGYRSDTLVYETYYITGEFTYSMEAHMQKKFGPYVIPLAVFLWSCLRYDIFQFFFDGGFLGRTPFRQYELPYLKWIGKKIVVSTYGADVRVESITEALGKYHGCMYCKVRGKGCICDPERAERNIQHISKYAHALLSMGDMNEYVPGSRKDIFFWAIDTSQIPFVGQPDTDDPILVLHAPNHPDYKGTCHLEEAIEALRREGLNVELLLVQKVPNKEALDIYKKAHIVAEQFLIGWYGYFAVEAMALGKPVITYIRKPQEYLPKGIQCPVINADPDSLKDALRTLIKDPALRQTLGEQGRRYVEEVHSFQTIGHQMHSLYQELWK